MIDLPRDYPVEVVGEGYVFHLGGPDVETFAVHNHAVGSLLFLDRRERILFSGGELIPGFFAIKTLLGAAQGWTDRVRPPGGPSLRHAPAAGAAVPAGGLEAAPVRGGAGRPVCPRPGPGGRGGARAAAVLIHTHAVPFNDIDLERREEQDEDTLTACREYTVFLHERTLQAAKEAAASMVPAQMGWAMVPGYDEYRCLPGVSRDLTAHVRHMASAIGT